MKVPPVAALGVITQLPTLWFELDERVAFVVKVTEPIVSEF